MKDTSSFEISLKGASNCNGETRTIDEHYEQAHAVVLVSFRRHNPHMIAEQGVIMGEFSEKYYSVVLRELIDSWGLWEVVKAVVRAATGALPNHRV